MRSIVVLYVVEALAQANFLAFLLVAKMDNTTLSLKKAKHARAVLRARLSSARKHGLNLPFFDIPIAPAVAFDAWLLENPLSYFTRYWGIDTTSPGDVTAYTDGVDPFDRQEMWELFNIHEPCWDSAVYIQKYVTAVGFWPGVRARCLERRILRTFPLQSPEPGTTGHFFVAYLRDANLGAALCFWQPDLDGATSSSSEVSIETAL